MTGNGAISGKVTDEQNDLPLQGISVTFVYRWEGNWHNAGTVVTDVKGDYKIDGLSPGTYHLSFKDIDYQYYGGVPDLDNADQISVGDEQQVADINAA